jgi:hypothetical protein
MKAPKTRKLIMLSSTINTLMGGTDPSSRPAGRPGGSSGAFLRFFLLFGCGDEMRGVGGFEVWMVCWRTLASTGAGGVGIGLFEVEEFFASDAVES